VSGAAVVLNDAAVSVRRKQALGRARAGGDIVAPRDMRDGRIGAIRTAVDDAGFADVSIMGYTAKYTSALYGPFRGALDPAPRAAGDKPIPADKSSYQMDPGNAREAIRELELDEAEGADIVMVKPAGPYLDIIRDFREHTSLPIAAYQVSGEYVMIKSAAASGLLDERALVMESTTSVFRAGADILLTYFAPQVADWLRDTS